MILNTLCMYVLSGVKYRPIDCLEMGDVCDHSLVEANPGSYYTV